MLYSYALTYDVVHGVPRIATVCDHDLEMDCPSGEIAGPATIEIDTDWTPETLRLDPSLPIFSSLSAEPNTGFSAYVGLGRFVGLEFQPEANVVCDGEPAVEGWRYFDGPFLWDSHLEDRCIDHEGLQRAIERGIADSTEPGSVSGGTHQILCAGSEE